MNDKNWRPHDSYILRPYDKAHGKERRIGIVCETDEGLREIILLATPAADDTCLQEQWLQRSKLLAAAPEMLAELERTYNALQGSYADWGKADPLMDMWLGNLKSVLAKAKGESEI